MPADNQKKEEEGCGDTVCRSVVFEVDAGPPIVGKHDKGTQKGI